MNWKQVFENWSSVSNKFKEKFKLLTDDDIKEIQGVREVFISKLMLRYSMKKTAAENNANVFVKNLELTKTETLNLTLKAENSMDFNQKL